jgi:NodT family efflux transporter outer membrane factor (OMF) lipoprotein
MLRHFAPVLLLAATLAAGCKTGPDYARPDTPVPEKWASERQGTEVDEPVVPVEWWTTLSDPKLNDLIARSVASNLDLRTAEARVREARAARGIAESALWPTLNLGAGYTRTQLIETKLQGSRPSVTVGGSKGPTGFSPSISVRGSNFSATRTGIGPNALTTASVTPGGNVSAPDRQADLFRIGFDSAWELDVFGGNRRAIEAAQASLEATQESHRNVLVSLLSEVALNYIELRTAQSRLDITNRNIEAQAKTLRITRARFEAGLTSELDPTRAEALLTRTQSQVPSLQTQVETAIHRLSVLMGQDPGTLLSELRPAAPLPTAPVQVPVGLPSDLLRRRPDIRQAERELAAATARIGVAVADLFPRFTLTGGISGQSDILGNILNNSNQVWNIGPGVSWPIFQGGRIRANIEVQNARQEQAALAYQETILLAFEDVENGLVSFAKEQEHRESLRAAVGANQRAVSLANSRYISGLEDFLSVLQAQQELFNSEDLLVQSQGFVLTDLVSLYKALGGGWETQDPAPAETAGK